MVDPPGVEPGTRQCECRVIPLYYGPAPLPYNKRMCRTMMWTVQDSAKRSLLAVARRSARPCSHDHACSHGTRVRFRAPFRPTHQKSLNASTSGSFVVWRLLYSFRTCLIHGGVSNLDYFDFSEWLVQPCERVVQENIRTCKRNSPLIRSQG